MTITPIISLIVAIIALCGTIAQALVRESRQRQLARESALRKKKIEHFGPFVEHLVALYEIASDVKKKGGTSDFYHRSASEIRPDTPAFRKALVLYGSSQLLNAYSNLQQYDGEGEPSDVMNLMGAVIFEIRTDKLKIFRSETNNLVH